MYFNLYGCKVYILIINSIHRKLQVYGTAERELFGFELSVFESVPVKNFSSKTWEMKIIFEALFEVTANGLYFFVQLVKPYSFVLVTSWSTFEKRIPCYSLKIIIGQQDNHERFIQLSCIFQDKTDALRTLIHSI
jgi:hypothetical protein